MQRREIINKLGDNLNLISVKNGYNTDFEKIVYWQDLPSEYNTNVLTYRDIKETYKRKNELQLASLIIEISAIVIETGSVLAPVLGDLALADVFKILDLTKHKGTTLDLITSDKIVETKGKTGCLFDLAVAFNYNFELKKP